MRGNYYNNLINLSYLRSKALSVPLVKKSRFLFSVLLDKYTLKIGNLKGQSRKLLVNHLEYCSVLKNIFINKKWVNVILIVHSSLNL
jgi:hypothetical protein